MSGSPGARLVDRVGVEVVPDTSGFVREVEAFLAGVKGRLRVEIPTSLDLDGITRDLEQVKAAAERLKVRIPIEYDEPNAPPRLPPIPPEKVRIDPDSDAFLAKAAADIRAASRALELSVPLTADGKRLRRETAIRVRELQAQVQAMSVKVPIDAEMAASLKAELRAKIAELQAIARTDPVEIPVKVDSRAFERSVVAVRSALTRLGSFGAASLKTISFSALALSAAGAVPVILSVASGLAQTAGSAALIPGAALGAAGGLAALLVGMRGFGDALKNMDDSEKFSASLEKLAPSARAAAVAIRGMGPAWREVQQSVQQALFDGVAQSLTRMSSTVLPEMKAGLVANATALSGMGRAFLDAATTAARMGQIRTILNNNAAAIDNMRSAVAPAIDGFMRLGAAGSAYLPKITAGAERAAKAFQAWAKTSIADGSFDRWLQGAGRSLGQIIDIAKSTGSVIGSIFKAADASGMTGLTVLQTGLANLAETMKRPAFQKGLADFFQSVRVGADGVGQALPAVGSALGAVGRELGPVIEKLGPVLGLALTAVARAAETAAPHLGRIADLLLTGIGGAIEQLSPHLSELVDGLGRGLQPIAQKLAEMLPEMGAALGKIAGPLGEFIGAAGELVAALLPFVVNIRGASEAATLLGGALQILTPVVKILAALLRGDFAGAFQIIQEKWAELGAAAQAKWEEIKTVVVTKIADLVVGVSAKWEEIKTVVVTKIADLVVGVSAKWEEIKASVTSKMTEIATTITTKWEEAKAAVVSKLTELAASAAAKWEEIKASVTSKMTEIATTITTKWEEAKAAVVSKLTELAASAAAKWEEIKASVTSKMTEIATTISTRWEEIKASVASKLSEIASNISAKWEEIKSSARAAWESVRQLVADAWDRIKAAVSDGIGDVVSLVQELPGRILAAIGDLSGLLSSAGASLMSGFASGISSMAGTVIGAAQEILGQIGGMVPGSPIKHGPLRSWNNGGAGRRLGALLADGLDASQGTVAKSAARLAAQVDATAMTSWPTTFTFEGAPSGMSAGINVHMTGPVYGPPEEYARAQERALGDALTMLRIGEVLA